jgi:hypothetical protein
MNKDNPCEEYAVVPDNRPVDARRLVNALRIAMYGDGGNFREEIENLGKLVAEFDGVPYMPEKNRLSQLVLLDDDQYVEFLNDPED